MSNNKTSVIDGGDLMLFIKNNAGKAVPMACATSHSITITTEFASTSHKDAGAGGWAAQEAKSLSWEASAEALWPVSSENGGYTFGDLFDAQNNKTKLDCVFCERNMEYNSEGDEITTIDKLSGNLTWSIADGVAPAGVSGAIAETQDYYYGQVIISSLGATAAADDNATISVSFTGFGALQHFTSYNSVQEALGIKSESESEGE